MKPTVSVIITSRSRGKRKRRLVGSSVANSLSSTNTSELVSALRSVDLPALVYPTAIALGTSHRALLGQMVDSLLKLGDPVAHSTPINLQFGLARAPASNTSRQP